MSSVMLLTGGTGAIGGALLERILRESDAEVHLLLHQRGTGCSVADLLREVLGCEPEPEGERRIHVLHGDVARERLGLDRTEYDALKHTLTHVIHSAATTRFDLPLETARSVNVEGTRRVLALAEAAPRLEATAFLSTAYVAGRRTGVVGERERAHVCGFVNTYEQSKYEAELLIEGASGRVPIAVYRLSTVLGDSATGAVRHYTAPHHALRMMHLGLVSMLPGSDEYPVDLIGADYTARVLYSLFTEHFEAGGRFHITSPEGKCYTLGEIVEETYRLLAEHDPEWAARRYPQPDIAPLETFELFVRSAEQANNPIMQGVARALTHFAQQLAYPKRFDRAELLRALPGYDDEAPDVRGYYGAVVEHCLRTGWDRRG